MPNISPNSSVGIKSWISIGVHDSIFPGYFNFKAEIKSNGWTYWIDSTQMVITDVKDEMIQPLTFKLEKNYPNPFNPSTKIKYDVPSRTLRLAQSDMYVILKVFDILGNEVATLVNEEKPAGSYEIEFDAE